MNKTTSIFLAALLATGLFLSSCSSPKPTPEAEEVSGEVATPEELRLSPEAVRRAGLQTLTIQERALENRIATTAEIQADENRVFRINSFAAGRISQDNVRLGDTIRQGQTWTLPRFKPSIFTNCTRTRSTLPRPRTGWRWPSGTWRGSVAF